jgi:hypothetical protein
MTKVVINQCYGGFSLSKEACLRYWEIKGKPVWIEQMREFKSDDMFTVWLTSPEERIKEKSSKEFCSMSMKQRQEYNKQYSEQTWYFGSVERHDPVLVQVVEELGEKAGGKFSELRIQEVSGPYRIDEYDGMESVETPDSYDWITP